MAGIFAREIGPKELVTKPVRAEDWAWHFGSQVDTAAWANEGSDTPGNLAAAVNTPAPIPNLPGVDLAGSDQYRDSESARNTPHLAFFGWINPTTLGLTDKYLLGKYDSGGPLGFRWYIRYTNEQQFAVFRTSVGTAVFTENVTSVIAGVWQHVGLVYDPDTGFATFYHNGEVTRTAEVSIGGGDVQASAVDMRIGANSLGSNPTTGQMALVGCLAQECLGEIDAYARALYESERGIFGV